jgi:hypothetical protein
MATLLEAKPYKIIKSQLKKEEKICIAFCNDCPNICELGKEKAKQVLNKLEKNGFNVDNIYSVHLGCLYDHVKTQKSLKGKTIIVWGCDSYVYNLKRQFRKQKVIPALNTVGLIVWDAKGKIHLVKEYKQQ